MTERVDECLVSFHWSSSGTRTIPAWIDMDLHNRAYHQLVEHYAGKAAQEGETDVGQHN